MVVIQQYTKGVVVVPSDTVDYVKQGTSDNLASALFVGGAGIVAMVFQDGTVVNFTCTAGQRLDIKHRRINSTNTTATLMVALYAL